MDKTKRTTVTMDILDWLEEDTKKELRDEERKKYANLRAEVTIRYTILQRQVGQVVQIL
jgi:hypothetical protein